MQNSAPVRFRHNAALAVAAIIAAVSAVPVVGAAAPLTPLLLVPLGVALWAWRAGTDADSTGVRVRALIGERRIPWARIDAILTAPGRRVVARLADGGEVPLTAVTPPDIPRLVAASGQPLSAAAPAGEAADRPAP